MKPKKISKRVVHPGAVARSFERRPEVMAAVEAAKARAIAHHAKAASESKSVAEEHA